jgi:hypothetical protein
MNVKGVQVFVAVVSTTNVNHLGKTGMNIRFFLVPNRCLVQNKFWTPETNGANY